MVFLQVVKINPGYESVRVGLFGSYRLHIRGIQYSGATAANLIRVRSNVLTVPAGNTNKLSFLVQGGAPTYIDQQLPAFDCVNLDGFVDMAIEDGGGVPIPNAEFDALVLYIEAEPINNT